MQVKQFKAPTLTEALKNVKKEFGSEAIILKTKRCKKGFGPLSHSWVEVTASISEPIHMKEQENLNVSQNVVLSQEEYSSSEERNQKISYQSEIEILKQKIQMDFEKLNDLEKVIQELQAEKNKNSEHLKKEMSYLKHRVEEMRETQKKQASEIHTLCQQNILSENFKALDFMTHLGLNEAILQEFLEIMLLQGIDRKIALDLLRKVQLNLKAEQLRNKEEVLNQLATIFMNSIQVMNPISQIKSAESECFSPQPIAFSLLGLSGVGKTTVTAQLSLLAKKRDLKVGILQWGALFNNKDFNPIEIYAKMFKLPFRLLKDSFALKRVLAEFRSLDLILVDISEVHLKDMDSMTQLAKSLNQIPQVQNFIVIDATTRDLEMLTIAKQFSVFRPQGLVFSKLDHARIYGGIYNTMIKSKLPVLFFGMGRKVPGDFEEATPERLASFILEIH